MQRDTILLSYCDIHSHFIQSKDLTTTVLNKINFSVYFAPSSGLKSQMILEFEHTESFYWLHFRNLGNKIYIKYSRCCPHLRQKNLWQHPFLGGGEAVYEEFCRTTYLGPRPVWSWGAPTWAGQPWLVPASSPAPPRSARRGPAACWCPPRWSRPGNIVLG